MAKIETVKMVGKKGTVLVNVSDVESFKKQGYKLASEPVMAHLKSPETFDFGDYTVAQLKDFAALAKIADFEGMKKAELVQSLKESGFKPERT